MPRVRLNVKTQSFFFVCVCVCVCMCVCVCVCSSCSLSKVATIICYFLPSLLQKVSVLENHPVLIQYRGVVATRLLSRWEL